MYRQECDTTPEIGTLNHDFPCDFELRKHSRTPACSDFRNVAGKGSWKLLYAASAVESFRKLVVGSAG